VTTVTGQPIDRAKLVSAICGVAGADIPIHPGAASPLIVEQRQKLAQQASALGRWKHRTDFEPNSAVAFMRDAIRKAPGEITLLAIGPLTNVALLFAIDPEIPGLLKQLVLMGGRFDQRRGQPGLPAEWNACVDPHATSIVYAADVPAHRSVGYEITTQVHLEANDVQARFKHPLLAPVLDFASVWFEHAERITFHDPLAAACVFRDDICEFGRGNVDVETHDQDRMGVTYWTAKPDGKRDVAVRVDEKRYFDDFFSVLAV
jgi:inosine-uridine nucleoside N-ribohydrolase